MKGVKLIGTHALVYILGLITAGGVGVAVAANIASSTVDYNKNSQATVEDALDDLYEKASEAGIIPYTGSNLALHIKDLYSYDGDGSYLYYHDQTGNTGTYTSAEYEAGDLSYRYSGPTASVTNYVCFASDEETCPSENLYRIIGIFKDTNNEYQVKLIKSSEGQATVNGATMLGTDGGYSSSTTYMWNTSNNSTWSSAVLNTVNLNTNYVAYLNAINSKWMNMIDSHTWKAGGNTWQLITSTAGAQNVYANEITTTPAANTTNSDEIGLMYVSDYMYGASPTYWNKMGYNSSESNDMRAATGSNWLYLGSSEWLIARRSDGSNLAFRVDSNGRVSSGYVTDTYVVRPVFYLKSDVIYYDGTGTSGDPYRIALSE